MANANVAKRANTACMLLELTQKFVAVVGTLLAIGAVVLGFFVDEPWAYGPVVATEAWHSILAGIIGGAIIAVQTLVIYAVLAALDTKVEETLYANADTAA